MHGVAKFSVSLLTCLRRRGTFHSLMSGNYGRILFNLLAESHDSLPFALGKIGHSLALIATGSTLPRWLSNLLTPLLSTLNSLPIVFLTPPRRHHLGKDRLHGGIGLDHRGMHLLACTLHGLAGILHLLLKAWILLDCLVMGGFDTCLLFGTQDSHRTMFILLGGRGLLHILARSIHFGRIRLRANREYAKQCQE